MPLALATLDLQRNPTPVHLQPVLQVSASVPVPASATAPACPSLYRMFILLEADAEDAAEAGAGAVVSFTMPFCHCLSWHSMGLAAL